MATDFRIADTFAFDQYENLSPISAPVMNRPWYTVD
jgi:hypothetical protein